MYEITACLLTFMVGGYSVVFAGPVTMEPYQPGCDDWKAIADALSVGSIECNVLTDCTGAYCSFLDGLIEAEVQLFPCKDLPELRITFTINGKRFLPLIFTHEDSKTLADFEITVFGVPVSLLQVDVEFQKQPDRIVFGICVTVLLPVFCEVKDAVVRTAPCRTPEDLLCQAMDELADSVTPPTSCYTVSTCDGISCVQKYPFSFGNPPTTFFVDVNTDLIVNSCDEVSMILTARSTQLNLDWTHTFTQPEETIPVDQDLTFGIRIEVTVTMQYMRDTENILTTIEYTIIQASGLTTTEYILQNAEVCIPNCKPPRPPTHIPMNQPPDDDECTSWEKIENALEFSFGEGYSISNCFTLPGCRGFQCSAVYEWASYQVIIEEFHCQDPTHITVSIIGAREQYFQTFTHNETVPIPFAEHIKLSVHLVQVSSSILLVGVTIIFPFHGGTFIKVPLVSDQLLRVTPCTDVMKTTENPIVFFPGDGDKVALDSQTLMFGGIALVVIVFAVILFVGLAVYCRRRRQFEDQDRITRIAVTKSNGVYEKSVAVSLPSSR